MTLLGLGLSGCSGKIEKQKEEPKPPITQQVATRAAEGTRYSTPKKDSDRRPLWNVKWESSNLVYGEDGDFSGDMFDVSGGLYQDGSIASTFRAEKAHVDQKSNVLKLDGNVSVQVVQPADSETKNSEATQQGQVLCDSVIWHPERKVGEAHGNVRYVTKDYTMGPFPILYFSPELKAIGTPTLFEEHNGKKH